jgi:hypothetical protein
MWKGPTQISPKLADVKPTCMLEALDIGIIPKDFVTATTNIKAVMAKAATRGFKQKRGLLFNSGTAEKFKFHHILFTVHLSYTRRNPTHFGKRNAKIQMPTIGKKVRL